MQKAPKNNNPITTVKELSSNCLKVRIDKYLWSIRIFKTRALAKEALDKGKVKMNEENVKASKYVNLGDIYDIKAPDKRLLIQVIELVDRRKKYLEIQHCYLDISPDSYKEINQNKLHSAFQTGKRLSKTGKPTRKDREGFDEFWTTEE